MGSKREYAEVEAPGPSRDGAFKRRKQYKNRPAQGNDGSSGPASQSLNEIKKRARDIQRRFSKADNMPADIQRNLERELAHCKTQIEDLERKKRRSDMIGKYHHVRFYERQKAERLRKQLKKRLDKADDPEEKAPLEEEFHIADVDWHYAKYFPFMERYVGLYQTAKTAEKTEEAEGAPTAKRALHAERPPMWKKIEAAMQEGQRALDTIQERTSETAAARQSQARSRDASSKKGKGEKERKDEKHVEPSKWNDKKRKDVPAQEGKQPKPERKEDPKANEGEDGLGFFAF
ncbi:unnamed protein product [Discula destructiva]